MRPIVVPNEISTRAVALSVLIILVSMRATGAEFGTIAEALTASSLKQRIEVHYRMFTAPMMPRVCRGAEKVSKLVTTNTPVVLGSGKWFALSDLHLVAMDRSGHHLSAVPVFIELENKLPALFNLDPEKVADGRIRPIRTGRFNFRVRTICLGDPTIKVLIPAVITK